MPRKTAGLHHVTCIAIDPQANLDFYAGVLGLRLVKSTVNFDAPDTYHFYYGDQDGHPGTILTFFPFVYAGRGRTGVGMVEATIFAVSEHELDDWVVKLAEHGVETGAPFERFGERVISFADPDGLKLELVGTSGLKGKDIAGFSSVSLRVEAPDRTVAVLTGLLGYTKTQEAEGLNRYSASADAVGRHIDVMCAPGSLAARPGGGTVHHIAFRAKNRVELADWRKEVQGLGFNVTPIIDRNYFESIYFREPGGILFEIATDPPGFTADEAPNAMGTSLKLPPQYEERRRDIERQLPPVKLPVWRADR